MGDLHVLDDDEQQQRFEVAVGQIDGGADQDDDNVEVDASQVSAQSAAAAQAVGVAHVGVERRPRQVEAAAHPSGAGAAVAAGAGVADLVECRRQGDGGKQREKEPRVVDHLAQRLGDTDMEEDPPIGSHQPGEGHDHYRRQEQWLERRPERSRDTLGHDTDPISEGQERVGPSERRAGPVGCGENTLGPQFLIDQELDVVAGQIALDPLTDDGCDFLRVPVAIGSLDNLVEQWW